jgi:sugar/nucleoside kinase (ribokinase family)
MLKKCLENENIDVSHCGKSDKPSGQGLVFLQSDGAVSSVVVHGSNAAWPNTIACADLVRGAHAVLLQREIPEFVNEAIAEAACAAGIPVFQDVGGEERPISDKLLRLVNYICPNKTELERLTGKVVSSEEDIISAAGVLLARGAQNVLITLGEAGSILVSHGGTVLRQACSPLPGPDGKVLDETGAGDAFRAAFAVALVEGMPAPACLQFAAAAGAIAVSRLGAVPSLPLRSEVDTLRSSAFPSAAADAVSAAAAVTAGESQSAGQSGAGAGAAGSKDGFPLKFGSRLNSMKDRLDLWDGPNDVFGWVARQGQVRGLDVVDFNYPQHLAGVPVDRVRAALAAAGLGAGCVCLRFPKEMQAGAYTNPDPAVRRRAVQLTVEAGEWARALGAREVVVWSAYCGYDYHLQADYDAMWARVVAAFQEVPCPARRARLIPTCAAAMIMTIKIIM